MYHVSLIHFPVFFIPLFFLCFSLDIVYYSIFQFTNPLFQHLIYSFFIYWVLNFTLSYVRISLVKLSHRLFSWMYSPFLMSVSSDSNIWIIYLSNIVAIIWGFFWGPLEGSFLFFVGWSQIKNRSPYSSHRMRCFRDGFSSLQRLVNRYMYL